MCRARRNCRAHYGQSGPTACPADRYAGHRDSNKYRPQYCPPDWSPQTGDRDHRPERSEEHTSELQSLMSISYAVFCLKKKTQNTYNNNTTHNEDTKTSRLQPI